MGELRAADIIVLLSYFAVVIGLGVYSMRRVRRSEDYFIGGRSFGKLLTAFAQYGEAVSADGPVMTARETFRHGLSGIWISLANLFTLPVYWFYFLWLRRFRYVTIGDVLNARYQSRFLTGLYSILSLLCLAVWVSAGFTAMGDSIVVIVSANPQNSDSLFALSLALTTGVVLLYGILGGIRAAVLSDCVQTLFMIFMTVVLIPFGFGQGGGLAAFRNAVPQHFLDLFGGETSSYTWYYVLALLFTMIVAQPAWPSNMLANIAKDERTVQIGVISGFLIKRVSVIAWALVGLLAIVFFSPMSISEGHEYGSMVVRLLAPLGMGLVGLMVGGLMAALMSTVSAHMIAAAATFTENVYKPSMSGRSDRHYMLVGRVASAVFLVTTALVSFEALATFGPVFWLGFVWRRANLPGAVAGIFTGIVVFFLLPVLVCFTSLSTQRDLLAGTKPAIIRYENQVATQYDVDEGRAAQAGQVFSFTKEGESVPVFFTGLKDEDGHRRGSGRLRPVVYVMYLLGVPVETFSPALFKSIQLVFPALAPFLVMLILSRCTRRVPKPILDDFYARMLTPAMGKPPEEDAREVAENAADFDARMVSCQFFPSSDWVIQRPNRFTVVGFFVVCAISLSLLGCLWLMAAGLRGWST